MYGLEKDKKGGEEKEMVFDLEKDIVADPANFKMLKGKVLERVQELKAALRSGADKDNFDKYGILLHGYVSLKKVMERVKKKSH